MLSISSIIYAYSLGSAFLTLEREYLVVHCLHTDISRLSVTLYQSSMSASILLASLSFSLG